jgi:hypothetical protein
VNLIPVAKRPYDPGRITTLHNIFNVHTAELSGQLLEKNRIRHFGPSYHISRPAGNGRVSKFTNGKTSHFYSRKYLAIFEPVSSSGISKPSFRIAGMKLSQIFKDLKYD